MSYAQAGGCGCSGFGALLPGLPFDIPAMPGVTTAPDVGAVDEIGGLKFVRNRAVLVPVIGTFMAPQPSAGSTKITEIGVLAFLQNPNTGTSWIDYNTSVNHRAVLVFSRPDGIDYVMTSNPYDVLLNAGPTGKFAILAIPGELQAATTAIILGGGVAPGVPGMPALPFPLPAIPGTPGQIPGLPAGFPQIPGFALPSPSPLTSKFVAANPGGAAAPVSALPPLDCFWDGMTIKCGSGTPAVKPTPSPLDCHLDSNGNPVCGSAPPPGSGTPSWVMPAAIGAGVLLLLLVLR